MRYLLAFLLATVWSASVDAASGEILAPGYTALEYTPPPAGSYQLPPLGAAANGKVISDDNKRLTLHEALGGKLVLMGFIYTQCSDINGCPLASYVMKKVQNRLLKETSLIGRVRFISLSFDPEFDTPDALKDYARHFRRPDFDWQFLTTESEPEIQEILEGYGQWRQKLYGDDGKYTGSMSHILRVFLIDELGRIRNIYSTGFLHPDTVINDLKTLALIKSD